MYIIHSAEEPKLLYERLDISLWIIPIIIKIIILKIGELIIFLSCKIM